MKNRAYGPDVKPVCPIRSHWCDVTCRLGRWGEDGRHIMGDMLCPLFQSLNCDCTGSPFKFKDAESIHWCAISCLNAHIYHVDEDLCSTFQSINCPGPVKNIYRGYWCDVTCEGKDRDLNQLCKLFKDLNCTGRPPKKTNSHWCDVTCESKSGEVLSKSSDSLCPTFQRLNC